MARPCIPLPVVWRATGWGAKAVPSVRIFLAWDNGLEFAIILESVIDPSRVISDQYRMMMLKTKDGRTYSGRILSRDAESTRIAPNLMRPSQTIAVAHDAIASEEALPVSVMPSGLVNPLNADELLDLVAYLVSGADAQHAVFKSRSLSRWICRLSSRSADGSSCRVYLRARRSSQVLRRIPEA